MKTYFFSFMRLFSKSPAGNRILQLFLQLQYFLIASAIKIATYDKKKLHWQLRKVILPGMYNCNFEAINQVLNKRMRKLDMEYERFTYIIIFCLTLSIRFRKEFLMLSSHEELLSFARNFFSYRSLQVQLRFKL